MKAHDFVGTWPLISLAARRDRIKLPAWILGISLFVWIATGVNDHFSAEEMAAIVTLAAENPAMRMLVSPIRADAVTEVSRFVFFRFSFVFSMLAAVMSIQTVTRHTRRNEETGCAEMTGSSVAGRYAGLAAAIVVGVAANIALAVLMGFALIAHGLPVGGSLAAGASFGGLGIVFTGVSALAAQLSGTGSGANGIGGIAFGAAFAVNGAANALGPINRGGMGFQSSPLAWLSPMGWTQRFYPFDDQNWWILVLFLALFTVLTVGAFVLVGRRDVGRGVLADRPGRARAPRWMMSPFGVAWRLQRATLMWWAFPFLFMGVMLGASAESLGETMGDTEFFGGAFSRAMAEFPFLVIGVAAMAASIYATKTLLRMRAEEIGPLENLLATPLKRTVFMVSHTLCGLAGSLSLVLLFGMAQMAAMRGSVSGFTNAAAAAAFQTVGVFLLSGFVLAVFGLVPKAAAPVSFAVVLLAIAVGPFFGAALNLPRWLMNASPFSHIAYMPHEVSGASIAVLLSLSLLLAGIGFAGFARRDLAP